jgi:hypothetical protein
MLFASWIFKVTDSPKYVILIAFPRQKWFRKYALNITFIITLPVLFLRLRVTLQFYISVERWWNDTERGNPKYSEENLFQQHFIHP